MSARMCAATGDLSWQKRYDSFTGPLDDAINEVERLAPELKNLQGKSQTNDANQRLVDMETQGFDLVRKGDKVKAWAILTGNEYETQKKIYAEGMQAHECRP